MALQSTMVSPETSGLAPASDSPFTWVPFWLPRSEISASPPEKLNRAWRREIDGSWSWRSAVSPRPTSTSPVFGSGNTHEESRSNTSTYGESEIPSACCAADSAGSVAAFLRSRRFCESPAMTPAPL